MYCSECGAKFVDGSKFCSSCGKRLAVVPTSSGWMRDEAVVAESKPKTEGKRPLWRKVLGDRERSALRCVLGIVMWVGIMLAGEILMHWSTGFDYIDMRTSEYVAKYGCSGLSGAQWPAFWIGILMNIAGIAMVCCWLLALLSRIRPANRGKSTKAKVVAVVICILFCFGFILLRWYGNGCKPSFSIWDGIILYAVCTAVWRRLVGVDKGQQLGNETHANYDGSATESDRLSTKVNDSHVKSRVLEWFVIGLVVVTVVVRLCVVGAFKHHVQRQKRIAKAERVAETLAHKQEAQNNHAPTLCIVAKIGDREVSATAMFDGEPFTSPWRWKENVKQNSRIPSSDVEVEYTEDGKRYVGTINPVTVNWTGQKTFVVALRECKEPKVGDVKTITLPGGATMEMVWCPPGSFMMGSSTSDDPRDDDEVQHRVTLTQGFWMGKYEVTQWQWESVMGGNPSRFKSPDRPVEQVSWEDCQEFIRKINTSGQVTVSLPTEAQWEYACRAGSTTSLPNGMTLRVLGEYNGPVLDEIAWYGGNSCVGFELSNGWSCSNWKEKQYSGSTAGTHPVKQKKPNDWGLYDMIGNVWEWCSDWYGVGYYTSSTTEDPKGPVSGAERVCRGGGWNDSARFCRSAERYGLYEPDVRGNDLGFRLVCSAR